MLERYRPCVISLASEPVAVDGPTVLAEARLRLRERLRSCRAECGRSLTSVSVGKPHCGTRACFGNCPEADQRVGGETASAGASLR